MYHVLLFWSWFYWCVHACGQEDLISYVRSTAVDKICFLVGWYKRWLAAYKGICHTKIILFFYGSDSICSTGGFWQCLEIPTICEQVLQCVVATLVG